MRAVSPLMLDHALGLAARGFYVFPVHGVDGNRCLCPKGAACRSAGKHPLLKAWESAATTDEHKIRSWWAVYPLANIAIACGPSNLVVLDVDRKSGGFESLEELVLAYGRHTILETVTVHTGGGGLHLFFTARVDVTIPCSNASTNPIFGPGIDIRAVGGYVIGPGSRHVSGKSYQFEISDENADAAPSLLPICLSSKEPLHPPVGERGEVLRERQFRAKTKQSTPDPVENRVGAKNSQKFAADGGGAISWVDPRPNLVAIARLARVVPLDDGGSHLSAWTVKWLSQPAYRAVTKGNLKNSQVHASELLAVARDYVRVYGVEGGSLFRRALERKRLISPDVAKPSKLSKDLRHPFGWFPKGLRAWNVALERPFTDSPIALASAASHRTTLGAARVYAATFLEALRLGVRVTNFSITFERIAELLGCAKRTAQRWIALAVELEFMTILNPGRSRAAGMRGRSATYALKTVTEGTQRPTPVARLSYVKAPRNVLAKRRSGAYSLRHLSGEPASVLRTRST